MFVQVLLTEIFAHSKQMKLKYLHHPSTGQYFSGLLRVNKGTWVRFYR